MNKYKELSDIFKFLLANIEWFSCSDFAELLAFNRYFIDKVVKNKFEHQFKV